MLRVLDTVSEDPLRHLSIPFTFYTKSANVCWLICTKTYAYCIVSEMFRNNRTSYGQVTNNFSFLAAPNESNRKMWSRHVSNTFTFFVLSVVVSAPRCFLERMNKFQRRCCPSNFPSGEEIKCAFIFDIYHQREFCNSMKYIILNIQQGKSMIS